MKSRDLHITNEQVRNKFNSIPSIETFINRRTLRYLGKIARSELSSSIPRKLLGAWVFGSRKIGRPQHYCNHSFSQALSSLLPQLSDKCLFSEWFHLAKDESSWNSLIVSNYQCFNNEVEVSDENSASLTEPYRFV